jgi:hypothetical protein
VTVAPGVVEKVDVVTDGVVLPSGEVIAGMETPCVVDVSPESSLPQPVATTPMASARGRTARGRRITIR